MDTETKELIGELTNAVQEVKEFAQTKYKEREEKGAEMGQTLEKLDAMVKDADKKFSVLEKKMARQNNASDEKSSLDVELKNVNLTLESLGRKDDRLADVDQLMEVKKTVEKYLRGGSKALNGEEYKSINGVIDPNGGYLVAPEYSTTLNKRKFDSRMVSMHVGMKTTGTSQYKTIFDNHDYNDGVYEDEISDTGSDAGNNDFKEITISVGDQYYPKKFSRSVLEDSFTNIDSEVMDSVRMGMWRKNADGILNGLGTTESPLRGMLTYADGTSWGQIQRVTSTVNDAIDFDDVLQKLPAELRDDYHANASFAMRRQTFFSLIVQKDNDNKYQIGNQVQFFSTQRIPLFLLGYPVLFDAGMPLVADGALAVMFGDLEAAYCKVDRAGFGIHHDDSNAKFVTLTGRSRCGGDVIDFDAYKLLEIQ